jgi:dolichyldiphosphatase
MIRSIRLTHVQYESKDSLGKLLAYTSLIPIFLIQSLVTLALFQRNIRVIILLGGQLLNELINYGVKKLLKHPRPHGLHSGIVP